MAWDSSRSVELLASLKLATDDDDAHDGSSGRGGSATKQMQTFLVSELKTHACPVCMEVMVPPIRAPTILFPCGHSFCCECVAAAQAGGRKKACPVCRTVFSSHAINFQLSSTITNLINKRLEYLGIDQASFQASLAKQASAATSTPSQGGSSSSSSSSGGSGSDRSIGASGAGAGGAGSDGAGVDVSTRLQLDDALVTGPSGRSPAAEAEAAEATRIYLNQYKQCSMRIRLMEAYAVDREEEVRRLKAELSKQQKMKDELEDEQRILEERLDDLQEQLRRVADECQQASESVTTLAKTAEKLEASLEETRALLPDLTRQRDKAWAMLRHYAPGLNPDAA